MTTRSYSLPKPHKRSDGRWVLQLPLGKDPTGKRKRRTFSGKTKKEVQARAEAFIEKHQPFQRQPTGRTVSTYLLEWYEYKKEAWSPRTQELYLHQIHKHIIPAIGSLPLEDLSPLDVQKMVSAAVNSGKIPTANKCRRLLFSAMKQAVRWELIHKNPVEAVDPVREAKSEVVVWEPEEAKAFLEAVARHRLYPAFYLMYASGMRRGELLGLRWRDLTDTGVRVEQALVMVGNTPTIGDPKSKLSRRFISLAPDALAVLNAHRETQRQEREMCGEGWTETGLVFCTSVGTPINPRNFLRTLKTFAKRAGIPAASVHALRHLHASLLISSGVDAKSISERLGHSSTSFTLDRYGHIFREHRSKTALTVAQLLQGRASI
jgi:integrase